MTKYSKTIYLDDYGTREGGCSIEGVSMVDFILNFMLPLSIECHLIGPLNLYNIIFIPRKSYFMTVLIQYHKTSIMMKLHDNCSL